MAMILLGETSTWQGDKGVVWLIGLTLFYTLAGEYNQTPSSGMKDLAEEFEFDLATMNDHDPAWYWISLVDKYMKDETIPGDVLPEKYQRAGTFQKAESKEDGEYVGFGDLLRKLLCKPEDRYALEEVSNDLKANMEE